MMFSCRLNRVLVLACCAVALLVTAAFAADKPAPAKAPEKPKAATKPKEAGKAKAKAETKAADAPKSKSAAKSKKAPAKGKPKAVDGTPHPSKLPWNLRAQYGLSLGDDPTTIVYSWDNAEWMITKSGPGTLIDNVGMLLTLADGSSVNVVEFDQGRTKMERVTCEYGE